MRLSDADDFAAFYSIEYGKGVSDEDVSQAWLDVETAIGNLFEMGRVRSTLKSAGYLVAQRPLQFHLAGVTVVAVPDVIAFDRNMPPSIVDWKVHAFGTRDARIQLALYAMALVRCRPHRDFPSAYSGLSPCDIHVLEAQLLAPAEREYQLEEPDFDDLEDYIAASAAEMVSATDGPVTRQLRAEDFAATTFPDLCQRCVFRKICWEEPNGQA
jgi:hypothetical protein